MYIVQVGDLHIGSATKCGASERDILTGGVQKIRQEVPSGQRLLICVCGDIIDSAKLSRWKRKAAAARYQEAAQLLLQMKWQLESQYCVSFRFCIGNHDATHREEFFKFARQFDDTVSKEEFDACYAYEAEGMYYIFINSCRNGNYAFGEIDYERLEQLLQKLPPDSPKMFVMHHAVISMYPGDSSSIRDSARLLRIMEDHHVLGVLHGHIHGNERFPIGGQMCQMIGTGALFSRGNPSVNSQFNLIYADRFAIRTISTCIYLADQRIQKKQWLTINLEEDSSENYFQGDSFGAVHKKLLEKLTYKPVLNNVVLQINSTYEGFCQTLNQYLRDDKLTIGQNQFSYFELAELWEALDLPPDLYFNHGSCFSAPDPDGGGSVHGIRLIAEQMKETPTSNRAVLTTFHKNAAIRNQPGDEYLPSLLSVQFSLDFERSILYVHMNLRALEAERFLKINICEIKWLLERLKEEALRFDTVDIAISAFRVQRRENFNCFLKAEIDRMEPYALSFCVYEGRISQICHMLEEKRDCSETITNVRGLKTLYEAMKQCRAGSGSHSYPDDVIRKLENIQGIYGKIDSLHQKCSIQTKEEKELEAQIHQELDAVIAMLKQKEAKI